MREKAESDRPCAPASDGQGDRYADLPHEKGRKLDQCRRLEPQSTKDLGASCYTQGAGQEAERQDLYERSRELRSGERSELLGEQNSKAREAEAQGDVHGRRSGDLIIIQALLLDERRPQPEIGDQISESDNNLSCGDQTKLFWGHEPGQYSQRPQLQ